MCWRFWWKIGNAIRLSMVPSRNEGWLCKFEWWMVEMSKQLELWTWFIRETWADQSRWRQDRETRWNWWSRVKGMHTHLSWLEKRMMDTEMDTYTYGTMWMCVNFRHVNEVTHHDMYPMPHVDELIDWLRNFCYITTLHYLCGYLQVPWQRNLTPLISYVTMYCQYRFSVMPFGINGLKQQHFNGWWIK